VQHCAAWCRLLSAQGRLAAAQCYAAFSRAFSAGLCGALLSLLYLGCRLTHCRVAPMYCSCISFFVFLSDGACFCQLSSNLVHFWVTACRPVYDTLLDDFEKGMTSARLDEIFGEVCWRGGFRVF
jgi:hypothetical protein